MIRSAGLPRVLRGGAARAFAVCSVAAAIAGCVHTPRAHRIIGPDGSDMLHVSCGSDQGACFALAGDNCPNGYRLVPIFNPEANNFLVRCQSRTHSVEAAENSVSPVPSNVIVRTLNPAPASTTRWPPPEEPFPGTDPWPAGSAASGSLPLPQTARLPDGQIDIGY